MDRFTFYRRLTAVLFLLSPCAFAQTDLTLAEASRRGGPEFTAVHLHDVIRVRGVVAAMPLNVPEYTHLIIQDATGAGLTLALTPRLSSQYTAGQVLEVVGELEERAGLPVLKPSAIQVTGTADAPAPQVMTVAELNNVANTGRLVTVSGTVERIAQNTGGEVLSIVDEQRHRLLVFLPWTGRKRTPVLTQYAVGDRIRLTGISAQYCVTPPFDHSFEVIVSSPDSITRTSRGRLITPAMFSWVVFALAAVMLMWWWRERNMRLQRTLIRSMMALAEDVISAPSMAEIARRIDSMLPAWFGAPELDMYLHAEGSQKLERIITERARSSFSIRTDAPIGTLESLVAVCYRNRTMLAIRDLKRSPLVQNHMGPMPKSIVLAPMIAQSEMLGILVLLYRRKTRLNQDFLLAVQHLANQVAASLRLQDQQLMKEQLLRTEKMAAAGQLISGVASDLRTPLVSIEGMANRLLENATPVQRAGLHHIGSEAQRGIDLVDHLLSFSSMEKREPKPLDIHALLAAILERRREDLQRRNIHVELRLAAGSVEVWADAAQMDQAMLTAVVHAEQAADAAPDRTLHIGSGVTGSRVHILFRAAAPADGTVGDPDLADYFGFPVAQAIVQSHGGDLRRVTSDRSVTQIELELPVLAPSAAVADSEKTVAKPARVMTACVVEPDVITQRKLVAMLGSRGHRAVPAHNAEEALEMAQRMQFDAMFCATRLPGLSWVELFNRVRRRVGVFALLTEGVDADAARAFAGGEGQVLSKPVDDRELDHVLGIAEVRRAVARQ